MGERWPYPVSQAMQRQTGCRIKSLCPAPPTQPEPADTAPAPSPALQCASPHPEAAPCQTDPAPRSDW